MGHLPQSALADFRYGPGSSLPSGGGRSPFSAILDWEFVGVFVGTIWGALLGRSRSPEIYDMVGL